MTTLKMWISFALIVSGQNSYAATIKLPPFSAKSVGGVEFNARSTGGQPAVLIFGKSAGSATAVDDWVKELNQRINGPRAARRPVAVHGFDHVPDAVQQQLGPMASDISVFIINSDGEIIGQTTGAETREKADFVMNALIGATIAPGKAR